jgi:hypothetical protein
MESLNISTTNTVVHFLTFDEISKQIELNPTEPYNNALFQKLNSKSFTIINPSDKTSRLLFRWVDNNPDNIIIYESYEFKNLYFIVAHTIIPDMIVQDYNIIVAKIYEHIQTICTSEHLFKLFDFKIIISLPFNIDFNGCYKYGPTKNTTLGHSLDNSYDWYHYNVKLNQYHAQHRKHRAERLDRSEKQKHAKMMKQ